MKPTTIVAGYLIVQALGTIAWWGMLLSIPQSMAIQGKGTPLPTATAPALVVSGPYRFVRNPMAVAGILQGLAVGWYLGSYGVVAYSLAGAVLWHLCVRRIEEADLLDRFGDAYVEYCDAVRLWLPRFHARRRKK